MKALVLHPYVPRFRSEDQEATWESLRALAGSELSEAVELRHVRCGNDDRWPVALRRAWSWPGPLVTIEQDCAPSIEQWGTILGCGHAACAFPYRLHPASQVREEGPVWSHRHWRGGDISLIVEGGGLFNVVPGAEYRLPALRWGADDDERADLVGLGFTRLGPLIRGAVALPPLPAWNDADSRISAAIAARLGRRQFVLHWPAVAHEHHTTANPTPPGSAPALVLPN